MSPHLQVKLLRVLQDRMVEPVGGIRAKAVNVRVIAATHVNLRELVKQGKFREDLFYRLQVVPVQLPSLRERRGDIPLLLEHFSRTFAKRHSRQPLQFSREALAVLYGYSWPGNVRELENVIQRLSILVDGGMVRLEDLPGHMCTGETTAAVSPGITELPEDGVDFNAIVEQFENSLIVQALERTRGNKKAAARLLKLNRTTLVEKIKKKGLESGERDNAEAEELSQ